MRAFFEMYVCTLSDAMHDGDDNLLAFKHAEDFLLGNSVSVTNIFEFQGRLFFRTILEIDPPMFENDVVESSESEKSNQSTQCQTVGRTLRLFWAYVDLVLITIE